MLLAAAGLLAIVLGLDADEVASPIGVEELGRPATGDEVDGPNAVVAVESPDANPDDEGGGGGEASAEPAVDGEADPSTADGVEPGQPWAPLTLLAMVDVGDHGAVGDGQADDTAALQRTFDSVPDGGGIVWLPPGRSYRTTDVVRITGDHTKLWAPNGQAEIRPSARDGERRVALIVDGATGVGLFGPTVRADGDRRRTALEDSAVVVDGSFQTEVVGLEVTGSPSAAIFVFGASRETWVVGNDLHDNWADAVHFTDGSRRAWVWDNVIFNDGTTRGDDGVACVTYGSSPLCGSMEWWDNTYLGGGWGRGLSVVGGDSIHVHDNLVVDAAAAGILVASEPSYDTPGSEGIRIEGNVVCRAGHTVPHAGILISGLDGAIRDVVVADNRVVDSVAGRAFATEGDVVDLVERDTSETDDGTCQTSGRGGRASRDTSVLATRDASFVPSSARRGLARVLVRAASGGGFEQQLEYVVAGPAAAVDAWLGDHAVTATRFSLDDADRDDYLVILTGSPLSVPDSLRPVDFDELRRMAGSLPGLWQHVDGSPGR